MSQPDIKQELVYINTVDKSGIESVAPVFHNERETIDKIILRAKKTLIKEKVKKNFDKLRFIRKDLETR